MFHGEAYSLKPELNSKIEEVGARLIPHVILGGTVLGRSGTEPSSIATERKSRGSSLLAAHILSGCDVTSKLDTKAAVIKQMDSTLSLFG